MTQSPQEKLDSVKAALEHAIRVMDEEVYVTRDQTAALTTIKSLQADIASEEMVEKVAKASYELVWTEIPWTEVGININEAFRKQAQAAIKTILGK